MIRRSTVSSRSLNGSAAGVCCGGCASSWSTLRAIAGWSEADVAVVDAEMKSFKGRITRDRWVAQAKIIATEGLEAFRERAKTNNY